MGKWAKISLWHSVAGEIAATLVTRCGIWINITESDPIEYLDTIDENYACEACILALGASLGRSQPRLRET